MPYLIALFRKKRAKRGQCLEMIWTFWEKVPKNKSMFRNDLDFLGKVPKNKSVF